MTKIANDLAQALRSSTRYNANNTTFDPATGTLCLYGHAIAQREGSGWKFNLCGYATALTRDRLNVVSSAFGLNGVSYVKRVPMVAGNPVPVDGWFYP